MVNTPFCQRGPLPTSALLGMPLWHSVDLPEVGQKAVMMLRQRETVSMKHFSGLFREHY